MTVSYRMLVLVLGLAVCSSRRMDAGEHSHAHPSKAPHGGEILELGADEYHAELVVDEKEHVVAVYILDGAAQGEVAIDAPYLNVNVRIGGKPVQHRLNPVRPAGQTEGPTACFALQSESLMKSLHTPGANPRLTLRIGKKAYVARIAHSHSHSHGASTHR